MKRFERLHTLWSAPSKDGDTSTVAWFSGGALLIMASDRLAHAIIALVALVWVYCLSILAVHAGARIFPRQGRAALLVLLVSFIASVFIFLLWLLFPLCALKMFFIISLIPVICLGSGIFERVDSLSLVEKTFASFSEAMMLGILLIIFSFIREPIGFLSLSLPGTAQGLFLLFSFESESFLPIHLVASSSGALLLLGYFFGLYRILKEEK